MKYLTILLLALLSGCSTTGYETFHRQRQSLAYDYAVNDISYSEYRVQMAIIDFNEKESEL